MHLIKIVSRRFKFGFIFKNRILIDTFFLKSLSQLASEVVYWTRSPLPPPPHPPKKSTAEDVTIQPSSDLDDPGLHSDHQVHPYFIPQASGPSSSRSQEQAKLQHVDGAVKRINRLYLAIASGNLQQQGRKARWLDYSWLLSPWTPHPSASSIW